MNTYGYAAGNPIRFTDPFGLLLAAPLAPAVAEGLINTIGAFVVLSNVFSGLTDSPIPDNLIPFPRRNNTPINQCVPEDKNPEDPCERARKTLQGNKEIFLQSVKTIKNPSIQAKQIRDFAKFFNPVVEQHNRVCPQHRVTPISIGPSPIR